jgi:glycine/D-amino acid oxidase-like deaminating enzyme/nitrite reductase/ring-hydroxylating ferredoxin subunit
MTAREKHASVWLDDAPDAAFPQLRGETTADVVVVGAGITGLTAALLLARAGVRVAVVEAARVGGEVTGYTTAHLATAFDTRYTQIASKFGEEGARLTAQSSSEAIDQIERFVHELQISCDFARVPGFLYTERRRDVSELEQELDAARTAGLPVVWSEQVPLPFSTQAGVLFHNQAQFNPLPYVQALARAVVEQGGAVYEHSRVVDVQDAAQGLPTRVLTPEGVVLGKALILATHAPIHDMTFLQDLQLTVTKVTPYRSYVIGVRLNGPVPNALFWDTDDPYHYIRSYNDILIVGGEDHRTGEETDTEQRYQQLEDWTRQRFPVASVEYRWSSVWYEPADGLPYIGRSPLPMPVYVATGFSGNGMTYGTIAGMIMADQVLGRENRYSELFDANRIKPLSAGLSLLGETLKKTQHFVVDRLTGPGVDEIDTIANDEGKVLHLGGEQIACYRDAEGELHTMSAVCPHAFCIVDWNSAEKSWDCPCHGSRFTSTGDVVAGPAVKPLERVRLENNQGDK